MAVTIDGSGGDGNGKELPKSGGREAFVGGGVRRDDRCVFVSVFFSGETW